MSGIKFWVARLWPLALFAGAVALMITSWQADPFDPSLEGTRRYGHNHDGALVEIGLWTLAELVILYAVLAPGSVGRRVWRAIAALLLFAPWTLVSLLLVMHAGGILGIHALWLMAVDVGITIVLATRAVARR